MRYSVLLILLFGLSPTLTTAVECYSTGNGNWNTSGTWSCDGAAAVPDCGDTVYVQSGHVVTVAAQNNYEACGTPLVVDVSGTLQFSTGNKLQLPCGSIVSLQTGGTVKKSTAGGGSSTLISICSSNVWTAGDGEKNGPLAWPDGGFVLPVELVSFEAVRHEDHTSVRWVTLTETNNDFFELERKHTNLEFSTVAILDGAGNSNSKLEYSYDDYSIAEPIVYYRLKQTDFDGGYEYSEVIQIERDITSEVKENSVSVIQGTSEIKIEFHNNENIELVLIHSINGSLVNKFQNGLHNDLSVIPVDAAGVYLLSIINIYGEVETHKVVIPST